jgi:hypothetical protein
MNKRSSNAVRLGVMTALCALSTMTCVRAAVVLNVAGDRPSSTDHAQILHFDLGPVPFHGSTDPIMAVGLFGDANFVAAPTAHPEPYIRIVDPLPAPSSVVQTKRPAVSATFSVPVDLTTFKLTLDGQDVSSSTIVSSTDFLFAPAYDLAAAAHTVRVVVFSSDGVLLNRTWTFTSGAGGPNNYLTSIAPAEGSSVDDAFTVSGVTRPNSRVYIAVAGSTDMGGSNRINTGRYSAEIVANASGEFSQRLSINIATGGTATVRITSVASATDAAATVMLHLHG